MTFTLPEELAAEFTRSIGSSRRSQYVAEALGARLRQRDEMLKEACLAANNDPETRQIEAEFDALPDSIMEEWDDSAPR